MSYVELTAKEENIVKIVRTVDDLWFRHPNVGLRAKGWWNGADAYTENGEPLIHYPGFCETLWANGVDKAYIPASDYILGTSIHRTLPDIIVPVTLNLAVEQWFGYSNTLLPYHLGWYYMATNYGIFPGGRGSGKTFGLALVSLLWIFLHPGEPWIHLALRMDQAKQMMEYGLSEAMRRNYMRDGSTCPRTFQEVAFDKDSPYRWTPHPRIQIKRWNDNDDGNRLEIRALGEDVSIENLRSLEAARVSVDEGLRRIPTFDIFLRLMAIVRGPNKYRYATLTPVQKREFNRLDQQRMRANLAGNLELEAQIEAEQERFGLARAGISIITGNSGRYQYQKQKALEAKTNPRALTFLRLSMRDNTKLTRQDKERLTEQFGSTPRLAAVELDAADDTGETRVIAEHLVRRQMIKGLHSDAEIKEHQGFGIIYYKAPARPNHFHVIAGDPGKGTLLADAYCVMAIDWTVEPAELVYFNWGNLYEKSATYDPYWRAYEEAIKSYPVTDRSFWVYDAGGQQEGLHTEIQFNIESDDEDAGRVLGYGMRFKSPRKLMAANWTVDLLKADKIVWPEIEALAWQLPDWELPDTKITNDVTMTTFMWVMRLYQYLRDPDMKPNPKATQITTANLLQHPHQTGIPLGGPVDYAAVQHIKNIGKRR